MVIEEIARSEDAPDDYVFELFTQNSLKGHALGLPVLGTRERVGSYEHADCAAFHEEHYHAGNLVVSAAGHVDHDALVTLCERLFAGIKPGTKAKRSLQPAVFNTGLFAQKRDIEQAHIVYGLPWLPLGHEDRYVGSVLTTILGGSMSSRLFQEVREKRGLAYSIFASQGLHQGLGQWCIYAGTRPDNAKEVVGLIKEELQRIANDPVSADELNRNVELMCGQLLLGLESTNSHMVRLGKRETLGTYQASPEEQTQAYRSVTAEQVLSLAQKMLTADPCLAVVSPFDESELQSLVAK